MLAFQDIIQHLYHFPSWFSLIVFFSFYLQIFLSVVQSIFSFFIFVVFFCQFGSYHLYSKFRCQFERHLSVTETITFVIGNCLTNTGFSFQPKAYDTSESFLRKSLAQVTFARKLAQLTFTTAPWHTWKLKHESCRLKVAFHGRYCIMNVDLT